MKARSRLTLQTVLVATIVVVALIYGLFVKPRYYAFNGGEIFFQTLSVNSFVTDDRYQMYAFDNRIFVGSKNGLKKLTSEGEEIWDKSFYIDNPQLLKNQEYMAMVDVMGKKAFLFSGDGFLSEITTEYPILFGALSVTGVVALVLEDEEAHRIQLYNKEGILVAERVTHFKDDGYPVAAALSDDAEILVAGYLKVETGQIKTDLCVFSFGEEGENHTENILGIFSIKDNVVPELKFLDNTHFVGIGSRKLQFYSVSTTPKLVSERELNNEINNLTYTQDQVLIDYGKLTTTEKNNLENHVVAYDAEGGVISDIVPEGELVGISGNAADYFVITDDAISRYKEEKRIWTYKINKEYTDIFPLDDRRFLMIGRYGYEILRIKDI